MLGTFDGKRMANGVWLTIEEEGTQWLRTVNR